MSSLFLRTTIPTASSCVFRAAPRYLRPTCARTIFGLGSNKPPQNNNITNGHDEPKPVHTPRVKSRVVPLDNLRRFGPQKRSLNPFKRDSWRKTWKEYPVEMTLSIIILVGAIGFTSYELTRYYWNIIRPLKVYPKEVEQYIRRALSLDIKGDFEGAIPFYDHAIRAAQAIDMDPLEDRVTGLKIKYAHTLEMADRKDQSIEVLDRLKKQLLSMLEERKLSIKIEDRDRVLIRCVGISKKLGELFVEQKKEKQAEEHLEWAVNTVLRESRRSITPEVDRRRQEFWSDEVVGATLEQLADFYEKFNQHELALPLYVAALDCITPPTCHSVVLMNNAAASLAQRTLPPDHTTDRAQFLSDAKQWAQKALKTASSIPRSVKTEECGIGCVVALNNLGEFEEQMGNKAEAVKRYAESQALAKSLSFELGVEQSQMNIKRLKEGRSDKTQEMLYKPTGSRFT